MPAYILRRLLLAIPTFFGITLVTFAVIHLAPGDPATAGAAAADLRITPVARAELRERYRLDEPIGWRYLHWLGDVVRFDFGQSFRDGRPVADKIAERIWPTLLLVGTAMVVSLLIAVPLGVEAARRAGGLFDRLVGGVCFLFYAIPRYVMAMILIIVVGVKLDWLPFLGATSSDHASMAGPGRIADFLRHSVLIGICFAYPLVAYEVQFIRDNVHAALQQPFILAARARGASELRIAYRHALPNALLPLLTLIGLMLPGVIGGSVILEVMFSWPGMGRLMFDSIMERDYPVVMALSVLSAIVVLAGTLIVDLLYGLVDPRVRQS